LDNLKPTYWLILSAAECIVMGPWETVPIPQLFWMAWCGNPWFGLLGCFFFSVTIKIKIYKIINKKHKTLQIKVNKKNK